MSQVSGTVNNMTIVRVKVGAGTVEVSVPSNKNADPKQLAAIAHQAGEAVEKHCQAQSEKGFFNSVKRLLSFKGKNKSEGRKTDTPVDEEPVILTLPKLVVIKDGKGLVHIDQPLKRKPPVAKKPVVTKMPVVTKKPVVTNKSVVTKKEEPSQDPITPDMLIGRRTTLRQTGIVW